MSPGVKPNFTVTKAYLPNRDRLNSYVDEIYRTHWLTNFGALHQRLEDRLREFLGVENLLLVSNGTLALQVSYRALDLKDEVITTPFSFVATTSSLVWEGLTPVFADIDPATLTLDPVEAEKKINKRTTGIVPVHVYGNACDVDAFEALAKAHQLKLVYDAAHAFGSEIGGRSLLNYGDVSTLSFHATKLFHSIEGGAIVTKDRKIYEKARDLINFGIKGPDRVESLGINCKMNEFQAAMGLAVLDEIEEIMVKRKKIFSFYANQFPSEILAPKSWRVESNGSYFPILLKSEASALTLRKALEGEGIFTRRYFYPALNTLNYVPDRGPMPIAENICARVLCIPIYPQLTDDEMHWIAKTISAHLEKDR